MDPAVLYGLGATLGYAGWAICQKKATETLVSHTHPVPVDVLCRRDAIIAIAAPLRHRADTVGVPPPDTHETPPPPHTHTHTTTTRRASQVSPSLAHAASLDQWLTPTS